MSMLANPPTCPLDELVRQVPTRHAARISLGEALRRFELEARPGIVHTGRYRCRYVTWGEGPPLVFIHGLGDQLRTFVMLMALLRKEFRCIAYNQPVGQGDGARLAKYRHEHLVDDLFALMDQLGIEQAGVVGHSYGSTIALRAMHACPARVSRGAAITGFAYRPVARQARWALQLARYWPGRLRNLPLRRAVMRKGHFSSFQRRDPEVWSHFLEHVGQAPIRAFAHWALELHKTDIRRLLPEITQPVLVICGDRDPLIPHSCQENLLRLLPAAELVQLRQCGHFPNFTHPEALADALGRFLRC